MSNSRIEKGNLILNPTPKKNIKVKNIYLQKTRVGGTTVIVNIEAKLIDATYILTERLSILSSKIKSAGFQSAEIGYVRVCKGRVQRRTPEIQNLNFNHTIAGKVDVFNSKIEEFDAYNMITGFMLIKDTHIGTLDIRRLKVINGFVIKDSTIEKLIADSETAINRLYLYEKTLVKNFEGQIGVGSCERRNCEISIPQYTLEKEKLPQYTLEKEKLPQYDEEILKKRLNKKVCSDEIKHKVESVLELYMQQVKCSYT